MITAEWENRMAAAWASFDQHSEAQFLVLVEKLVGELSPDDPVGLFERAGSLDAVGQTAPAVALYRQALDAGLAGSRRRQAVIQLASSLRALGEAQDSIALLTAELAAGSDELDDAVKTVLALALTDAGREREAVAIAVGALSAHLPRYQRSMANYARALLEPDPAADPEADVRS
jgi:tetratricopeptide (TPR) repeat protein